MKESFNPEFIFSNKFKFKLKQISGNFNFKTRSFLIILILTRILRSVRHRKRWNQCNVEFSNLYVLVSCQSNWERPNNNVRVRYNTYPLSSSRGPWSSSFFALPILNLKCAYLLIYSFIMILDVPTVWFNCVSKKSTIRTPISSKYFSNVFSGHLISYLNLFEFFSPFLMPLAHL